MPRTRSGWFALTLALASQLTFAHNNPTFREDKLATVEVPAGGTSASFTLTAPDKTVQYIFKVSPPNNDVKLTFEQAGKVLAEGIGHDGTSSFASGEDFTLTATGDAAATVTIVAKVLDRSAGKEQSADSRTLALGKKTYKKANCVGCHKWHGGGGGGYGGAAKSLRETTLTRDALIEVVRCGRPGTGMPSHVRGAYAAQPCYGGVTAADLGDNKPPKARSSLRQPNIEAVVDYVMAVQVGRGEPTLEECKAYWGDSSSACNNYN